MRRLIALALLGCSSETVWHHGVMDETGGAEQVATLTASTGGQSAIIETGGSKAQVTGGRSATGGQSQTGGRVSTGGASATGGMLAATGGSSATAATGGAMPTGGTTSQPCGAEQNLCPCVNPTLCSEYPTCESVYDASKLNDINGSNGGWGGPCSIETDTTSCIQARAQLCKCKSWTKAMIGSVGGGTSTTGPSAPGGPNAPNAAASGVNWHCAFIG